VAVPGVLAKAAVQGCPRHSGEPDQFGDLIAVLRRPAEREPQGVLGCLAFTAGRIRAVAVARPARFGDDGRREGCCGERVAGDGVEVRAAGRIARDGLLDVVVPVARRDWEHKAAAIAAYRETYGFDHPGDPIGPEPSQQAPDQRAAWHEAFAALSPANGPDTRALSDGRLWLLRDTYAAETVWAPRHTGKDLRLSRLAAIDADLGAIRADAETAAARKVGDHARAARHEHLAASYRALRDFYQQREQTFARAMDDRRKWEQATAQSRQRGIAADAELRRRHPNRKIGPLRSAEPAPVSDAECQHLDRIPHQRNGQTARIRDLEVQQQAFRIAMNEHRRLIPNKEMAWGGLGQSSPTLRTRWPDAILQPPKPQITPSAEILQSAEPDIDPEAGG
jgi:hypothetical protein